jgi:serine/threonine protein kinase
MAGLDEQARSVFLAALDAAPEQWPVFVAEACGEDDALRGRVEQLLRAHREMETIQPGRAERRDEPAEHPGASVGPYRLLEQIGEGGMGAVYLAEQQRPVRRQVALKVIKAGMDTRQVIARFEAERQAVAMMDHPNIAKVFDAGVTDAGRPYFVMDLVKGEPITKHCDRHRLPPRQRLELFVQVCQAVQHAHQKGIIHRDLKPTNVLVAEYDGRPVPKVIDFGVAKATGQRLTERTTVTGFGGMIGTPQYMSPEQAESNPLDVDTRSDIYSLGVLLYELLTGTTPLESKRLKEAALPEVLRVIREEEPPRPSTRLTATVELAAIAAQRGVEPKTLSGVLRGELDWIVMKALEKDRTRRYETADGLARDIQRYLQDEPVQACPPTAGYRFGKFARRNKAALVSASVIATVVLAGAAVATWQAVRATQAKATAEVEKQRADEQAAIATSITRYLEQMLGSFTTASGKGPDYPVLQLFNDYAADLETQLPNHPEVEATLRATIGKGYSVLGQHDQAKKHLARALELRRNAYGENHEKYADSLVAYASPGVHSDPAPLPACEEDLRRALAIYRARGVGGQPVIRALWALRCNLVGQAYAGAPAKWDDLEPVVKEAQTEARKFPGTEFPEMAGIYQGWAESKMAQGRYAEAETIAREAVAMTRKLRPDHPEVIWGHFVLAKTLRKQNKFNEALAEDKGVLAVVQKLAPLGHKAIALTLTEVIDTLNAADESHALTELFPSAAELGELESVFRQVLATSKPSSLDYADPALVAAHGLIRFGEYYLRLGDEFAAAGKAREAEESRRKANLALESLRSEIAGKPDLLPYLSGIETKKDAGIKSSKSEKDSN